MLVITKGYWLGILVRFVLKNHRRVISFICYVFTFLCTVGHVSALIYNSYNKTDQPRGLVVRASGYKSRGPGFDSRLYHGDFPCGGRIPVVTMVWVASRIRFKVETSLTGSHTSINSWLNPRQRSTRWRGPDHDRQPAHQLIEYPSTLIADYGREIYIYIYIYNKTNKRSDIKIIFLQAACQNCDMFRSILFICINKAYIKTWMGY